MHPRIGRRRPGYLAFLMLLTGAATLAQEEGFEPGTLFETVDVEVVNVEVFVTDSAGEPVTGLGADDFRLLVDGKEIEISNFYAQVAGRPVEASGSEAATTFAADTEALAKPPEQQLYLVVFVDNPHITPANRKRVFRHLRTFLDQNLSPDDAVTVVTLNRSLKILSDFSTDRQALAGILDQVAETSAERSASELYRQRILNDISRLGDSRFTSTPDLAELGTHGAEIRAYAESRYNRARESLDAIERLLTTLAGVPGRRALIHISDGIETRPGEALYELWREKIGLVDTSYEREIGEFELLREFRRLGRAANATRVTLYAIDGESNPRRIGRSAVLAGGQSGSLSNRLLELMENNRREPLELAAQTTGGQRVQASPTLDRQLARLATDFRTFYSLGFISPEGFSGKLHAVEVRLAEPGLRVRHRETYEPKLRDRRFSEATVAALLYNATGNALEVALEPGGLERTAGGQAALPVTVMIPVKNLVLLPRDGSHTAQLSFFVTIRDEAGDLRPIQKLPFHLTIPADKLDDAQEQAASYRLTLLLGPDDRQAVIGVRDDLSMAESTLRLDLDLSG